MPKKRRESKSTKKSEEWYQKRQYQLTFIGTVIAILVFGSIIYDHFFVPAEQPTQKVASIKVKVDQFATASFVIAPNGTIILTSDQTMPFYPVFRNSTTDFYVHVVNDGDITVYLKEIVMNSNQSQVRPEIALLTNEWLEPNDYRTFVFPLNMTSWALGAGEATFIVAGEGVINSDTIVLWITETKND